MDVRLGGGEDDGLWASSGTRSDVYTGSIALKPARICFPFSGDIIGGSHLSVLGLLCRLDRTRFDPLVVTQYPRGKLSQLFSDHGLPVWTPFDWPEVPPNRRVGLNAIKAALARAGPQITFLRRQGIDIVHTNDGRTHVSWAFAAKLAGAKLLWHHRGHPDARGLRFAAPFLADRVLAVSEFALPRKGLISAARKAQVVHSPFDTELLIDRSIARQILLDELDVPPETLLIAFSGSFIDRKRPLQFIEVIRRMRESAPDRPICGVMFGNADEPEMDNLMQAQIAKDDLAGVVRLMDWRSPGAFWIAASDLLIVPAIDEPFGRTLIEAQLVGTPVVATRSGGNIEALKGGELGVLVEPEDPGVLAEAVLALSHDDRQNLAERARHDARNRFGIDMHCHQVCAVYDRLLARH
jgi:glycosyltransferase involved in cell wall biosynthesis